MKKLLIILMMFVMTSCKDKEEVTVFLDDHRVQIDLNTALSKANEERITLLEQRMDNQEHEFNLLLIAEYEESLIINIRLQKIDIKIARNLRKIRRLRKLISRQVHNILHHIRMIERDYNIAINNLENNMLNITNNLQNQINDVMDSVLKIVYPCGEGMSQEVLLDTVDGLVAYFQSGHNESIVFEINEVIPSHKTCVSWKTKHTWCGLRTYCTEFHYIPSATITEETHANFFILDYAYLDVLDDGYYRTTDGYNCTFQISDGELVERLED